MMEAVTAAVEMPPGCLNPDKIAAALVKGFLSQHSETILAGGELRVSFCFPKRAGKRNSRLTYEEWLARLVRTGDVEYENDFWYFNFDTKKYMRTTKNYGNGEVMVRSPIHLTALEQLTLYFMLIQERKPTSVPGWNQTICGLRKKFGKDFLETVKSASGI